MLNLDVITFRFQFFFKSLKNIDKHIRQIMRKLLLFLALFGLTASTQAQSRVGVPSPGVTVTPNNQGAGNLQMIGGSFEVLKTVSGKTLHYGFNYMLYPRPFNDVINMNLSTANPQVLSGKIVNDATGKTEIDWTPGNVGYRYKHTFDVSNLAVGSYHFDIYDDNNNIVYTIPFDKPGK